MCNLHWCHILYIHPFSKNAHLKKTTLFEPQHEISNNVICATGKDSDQTAHMPAHMRSLIRAFASRFLRLLTQHHLEFLSLKGGLTGSSESSLVKIPHCWKSHVAAHFLNMLLAHS